VYKGILSVYNEKETLFVYDNCYALKLETQNLSRKLITAGPKRNNAKLGKKGS